MNNKTKKLTTIVMLFWNYLITPFCMGYPREAVVGLLLPVFLLFNLIKLRLNGQTVHVSGHFNRDKERPRRYEIMTARRVFDTLPPLLLAFFLLPAIIKSRHYEIIVFDCKGRAV